MPPVLEHSAPPEAVAAEPGREPPELLGPPEPSPRKVLEPGRQAPQPHHAAPRVSKAAKAIASRGLRSAQSTNWNA